MNPGDRIFFFDIIGCNFIYIVKLSCSNSWIYYINTNGIPGGLSRTSHVIIRSEIGDEFHHLLKCTHSSLSHIRGIFLESLYSINSNFTNMSCKALFLYIMSMCDENIINLSASYIENILNCYASEL